MEIVWLVIGIAIGSVIAGLLVKMRSGSRLATLEERARAAAATAAQLAEREDENSRLREELAAQEARAGSDRAAMEEKLALLENAKEKLGKEFENLANRIFEDRSAKFAGDNRSKLEEMLKPFTEQLGEFKNRVNTI